MFKKEDHYVEVFMGTDYTLEDIRTVKDLKLALEGIIADLPEDDGLKIEEVFFKGNELSYTLKDGIY